LLLPVFQKAAKTVENITFFAKNRKNLKNSAKISEICVISVKKLDSRLRGNDNYKMAFFR
jgi:hypothetical protein